MKFIDCAKKVVEEKSYMLIRNRKNSNEYDVKAGEGSKRGWTYLDGYSASAVVNVYNALNLENKLKFESLSALKAINVAFRLIQKYWTGSRSNVDDRKLILKWLHPMLIGTIEDVIPTYYK